MLPFLHINVTVFCAKYIFDDINKETKQILLLQLYNFLCQNAAQLK